jgi:hypothetical protein
MSADWALVRFPDGEVRWTLYNVVDEVERRLATDPEPVFEAWHGWREIPDPEGPVHPVDIYSNYGCGFAWPGTATKDRLLDGWNLRASEQLVDDLFVDGQPRWVTEELLRRGMATGYHTVALKFPDGEVRWTLGRSVCEIVPRLADRVSSVTDAFLDWRGAPEPIGPVMEVEINSGPTSWLGRAAKNVLVAGQPADVDYDDQFREWPDWVKQARLSEGAEALEAEAGFDKWNPRAF